MACGAPTCLAHARFDARRSSTYATNGSLFGIRYGTGEVSGLLSQDHVTVGPLVVPGQTPASPLTPASPTPEPDPVVAPPVVGPAVPRPAPGPVTVETIERANAKSVAFKCAYGKSR